MHVSVRPLAIRVENTVIGEDPTFQTGRPFARADELYVSVSPLALLRGRIELRSMELRRPSIELARNAAGAWNFTSLGGDGRSEGAALRQVVIAGGEVGLIDLAARDGRRVVYRNIDLTLDDYAADRPFDFVLAVTLPGEFLIRDWTRQNKTWFAAVQVEKRMMFIILTLIVAVAAFNLVSTLVMTVTDKRADIAILRTLGSSPRSIMGIFVVQGAMVGVIGTVAGLLLGLGIAYNIDVIVPALERLFNARFLPQDIYLISKMPSDPQRGDILPITLISLVLAFVATLYPSWRASRVNPAEALRYE